MEEEQDIGVKDGADDGPETLYLTPQESPLAALLAKTITEVETSGRPSPGSEDLTHVTEGESFWQAAFAAGGLGAPLGTHQGKVISRANLHRMLRQGPRRPDQTDRLHQRDLPLPPRHHGELGRHPLGELFRKAEETHLQSHKEMGSWIEGPKEQAATAQILDCMWVYTYKLDRHGFFLKCKARLVVRGDQQDVISEETYASTLAARSFRTLIAIAARFDLELVQYDAVNAFVNAPLERKIFMKPPPGSRNPGKILLVSKALYGLRESPLLWQKELSGTLEGLGFKVVPHEPCCMIRDRIIIFYYVDDIVLAFRKHFAEDVTKLMHKLQSHYMMTGGHELQWFLGIAVLRDREKRLIWLSQSEYALKIANLVTVLDAGSEARTPMTTAKLQPNEGRAMIAEIRSYQRKIGSILYIAVITRPDVAFAVSQLARYNQNPSLKHHKAADRTLLYLKASHGLALQLGGGDDFDVASDASFAENLPDRKSSQAYVMKLFGGVIGWRANKQATVTTSTTEAELLALSQAAKEGMFLNRLLKELGLDLKTAGGIRIQCDNQQTIKLVTKQLNQLNTRLRHVDIHNHWLRQEAGKGTISVHYTPTGKMLADGLTKALTSTAFDAFVQQLGLVDVTDKLKEKRELDDMTDTVSRLQSGLEDLKLVSL